MIFRNVIYGNVISRERDLLEREWERDLLGTGTGTRERERRERRELGTHFTVDKLWSNVVQSSSV